MNNNLRQALLAAASSGALTVAATLITGSDGKNGFEGLEYKPYLDVTGVPTVCYGHTGKDIILNKIYNKSECLFFLKKDLTNVASKVDPDINTPISREMRGALYSFVYNVGFENFRNSTILYDINRGDKNSACKEIRRWIYADGVVWKGLMNRRKVESEVCEWGSKWF